MANLTFETVAPGAKSSFDMPNEHDTELFIMLITKDAGEQQYLAVTQPMTDEVLWACMKAAARFLRA